MKEKLRFLGMDVHAETIAAAIAEPDGEVRSLGTIPNRMESVRKLLKKLGPVEKLRVCYEAGPTGYVLYWQLAELGVQCEVIAPSLVPVKAGDRVKTDRRDAEKLARSYRSGDLMAVWVPDAGSEALRDLVRAREAAKQDQLRARHRLGKFLLRSGQRPPSGVRAWTHLHLIWVSQIRFTQAAQESTRLDYLHEVEHMRERVLRLEQAIAEAVKLASPALQEVITDLQALRGIAHISAVTIAKFFRQGGAQGRFPASRWAANQIEHILCPWRSNVIAKSVCVASAGCGQRTLSSSLANSVQNPTAAIVEWRYQAMRVSSLSWLKLNLILGDNASGSIFRSTL
jgi:transposase